MTSSERGSDEQATRQAVARLFEETRRRLVETGTRNRLVHVNRANTRGNVLNVVNVRSDDVYALLAGGKTMRFAALGSDSDDASNEEAPFESRSDFAEARQLDGQLETRLGPDALQKKLLKIAREARTAEEESGINMLYLAMGFLTWYEDKSSKVPREAPLLLVPVELVRNARTSTYDVRLRDEDVFTNLPLQQRFRDDFGMELPEVPVNEDFRPSDYFEQVSLMSAQREDWKLDCDAMQLGFFSFSKLLMFRDLALEAWPDDALANHPLTRGLLHQGFGAESSLFSSEDRLDALLPPEKLVHVVDADASQAKVIEEVRAGRNLVVQGPPGTGKSQTITNMIAAAVNEGKRVLFLAEKMAALSVVHERLRKAGLEATCLELHSRTANKKSVLSQVAQTLSEGASPPAAPDGPATLKASRDRLNELADSLHRPIGETQETAYSVLGLQCMLMSEGRPPPTLADESLNVMSRDLERSLISSLEAYAALLTEGGPGEENPFIGTRRLDLQPVDLARLKNLLLDEASKLSAVRSAARAAAERLSIEECSSLAEVDRLADLLERLSVLPNGASDIARIVLTIPDVQRLTDATTAGALWFEAREAASPIFEETAFDTEAGALRGALTAGVGSFFARWGTNYRRASRQLAGLLRGPLPKSAAERVERIDQLMAIASLQSRWREEDDFCRSILGHAWRGARTDFRRLLAIIKWCAGLKELLEARSHASALDLAGNDRALSEIRDALQAALRAVRLALQEIHGILDLEPDLFGRPESFDLRAIDDRFSRMATRIDKYDSWVRLSRLRVRLAQAGLGQLVERMSYGDLDAKGAIAELRFARAEALWNLARTKDPILRDIGRESRHDLVKSFAILEKQRLKDNVATILAKHLGQLPQGAEGEMRVVRGEIARKRGQMALRKLFETAGTAIQRIKPVLMMSPISVAQFLPPGIVSFDLLIIDEASQVRPEDALGAIARARQIVVVGDRKQLPPTSFFDRLLDEEQEPSDADDEDGPDLLDGAAKVGDAESILTLCEGRGLPPRMLEWHYRSRDPSLIAISNDEFYQSKLVLPPSPLRDDEAFGLRLTRVPGAYDRGGKRNNPKECEAIVDRIAEHARVNPTHSIGVVTFSSSQRDLITQLLDFRRGADPALDELLREGKSEDLFVKNIENVQGDERDVILISVGYGPTVPGGRLNSMSFGPINTEGGERRLNVLFTRARTRCEVFASFDPSDMDLTRTAKEGPRILKRFLDFAKTKQLDQRAPMGLPADSPLEEDVANVVRSMGFLADPQVGSGGFRIDIGVRHPEKPGAYILAIECDGATYHRALWARERDRQRQEILEHLGWRFHRIWSTDWFHSRSSEMERLRAALLEARRHSELGARVLGTNEVGRSTVKPLERSPEVITIPEPVARRMPPYRRAVFPLTTSRQPHEVETSSLADLAERIVSSEGPIHVEEVARRIAACFRKEKAGSRTQSATELALVHARSKYQHLLTDGVFWYTSAHEKNSPVRDRSAESGATLKASNISLLEIKAALKIARDENAGGEDEDLIRGVSRLLGFKRTGQDLQTRIMEALKG